MGWSEAETEGSVVERFERQARLGPDRVAIAGTSRPLSYTELSLLADRYAGALSARLAPGWAGGGRAALLLRHDGQVIAAALAALKCGMAVIVLNPGDPPARHAQIRLETQPNALITDEPLARMGATAGFEDAHTVVLPTISANAGAGAPVANPGPAPSSDDLAFLICTSGSGGRPKVVMQSHRNVLHNVLRYTNGLQINPADRVALMASLSGGQGLATTWTTLLNGATLCPFPIAERGVTGLAGWLADNGVTVFDTIPSVLRSFAQTLRDERIPGVRLVRLASEGALHGDFETFRRHFPADCRLASVLASSEAGVIAQALLDPGDDLAPGRLPVGRPAEGIDLRLVTEDGRPAANGDAGEIVLSGRYLSPGYWGDEALTAERFVTTDDVRSFRTGDLAVRSEDGVLTVIGRADKQVKVRGHRLQLEEVEAAIAAHPTVGAVAVLLRHTSSGDAKLTGYVTAAPGATATASELRRSLQPVLPAHAIPAALVIVPELPINAHGKIDRERLDEIEGEATAPSSGEKPQSQTEELMAGLWANSFERSEIDRNAAFLELGGDSLLAAQIAAGIYDVFEVDLHLGVFAANPTVATLAAVVDERRSDLSAEELPPLRRTERSGPLSFAQARFWPGGPFDSDPRQHVLVPFDIRGPLEVEALRQSVETLVRRHEILRTTFARYDERPMAVVMPPARVPLPVDDLRAVANQRARLSEIIESELLRPYDLRRGPLFRLRLLRLGDEHYQLLRLSHHLIHDAASWRIFFNELALVYEALIDGRPSPLPEEIQIQYLDYAVWERARANSPSRSDQAEVTWWRHALDSLPAALELPFSRPEPQSDATPVQPLWWGLPAERTAALDHIGRTSGATFYMTRLAVFTALVAIESGGDDFLVGTPVSARTRPELQRMFGPLINFRPLRLRFNEDPSFRGWLDEVRRVVIDTSAHSSIPWEVLRRKLLAAGVVLPPPSAMFIPSGSVEAMRFGGVHIDPLPRPRPPSAVALFKLGLNRPYESDRCWAELDARVHDPAGVEAFLSRLQSLVAGVCAEPDRSMRDLHAAGSLA